MIQPANDTISCYYNVLQNRGEFRSVHDLHCSRGEEFGPVVTSRVKNQKYDNWIII